MDGAASLAREIGNLAALCRDRQWRTDDPLGLGGLLCDAFQAAQLIARGVANLDQLLPTLLAQARPGLEDYARRGETTLPAGYRLAFRELGLSLGLRAASRLAVLVSREAKRFRAAGQVRDLLSPLLEYLRLGEEIENFWLDPRHQEASSWREHLRINQVMLVTSLAPDTFLGG
jgi:hypothetical protein